MNLLDIKKQDIYESFLSDCLAPWFMGMTRMIVLSDVLLKTEKELLEWERVTEEKPKEVSGLFDDANWIQMLESAPETNFFLFVWNKNSASDLEKWLLKNATIHEFSLPSESEICTMLIQELWVSKWQAERIQQRLNYNYYFITQEIKKLKWAEKKTWTDEELKDVLPNYFEENNFAILNPLWDKNTYHLFTTFQDTLRTADRELTMAMTTTMIRKILIATSLPYDSIENLPMIKPSQINTAKKITKDKERIQKLYDAIVRVDTDEKQWESINKLDAFLMALLTYCEAPEML